MGKQLAITDNGVFVTGSKAFLTVNGVHRKVLKIFRTTDGVHRLCFSGGLDVTAMAISYSGKMTDEIVTMSDGKYRLLTLTSSGTLTVDEEVEAEVWMCNGGNSGGSQGYYFGGGGGHIASATLVLPLSATAFVGSGGKNEAMGMGDGGRSSFYNDAVGAVAPSKYAKYSGASGGGSGGDGGGSSVGGTGESTYPFGDTAYFANKPHSAGGGGGGWFDEHGGYAHHGGDGGTNGSSGKNGDSDPIQYAQSADGGAGGVFGGGAGGWGGYDGTAENGENAFFYGSGGGGSGVATLDGETSDNYARAGYGYQGVIYIRIPLNQ